MLKLSRALVAALAAALTLAAGPASAATLTWTAGGGLDQSWSNPDNWDLVQVPTSNDSVVFDLTANNTSSTVDQTFTIGTMWLTLPEASAATMAHNMTISSGSTLNLTGDFRQGIGSPDCATGGACAGHNTNVTISGQGTLAFNNPAGSFLVGIWSGNWDRGNRSDMLNMSGLASLWIDANLVEVGRVGAANPNTTFRLADNSQVITNVLDIARWNDTAFMELGRVTTLQANTIHMSSNVSQNSANSTIRFQTSVTDPSVVIRNRAGTGGANLNMAHASQAVVNAALNLAGGNVDALFDTMHLSVGNPHAGNSSSTATSTITFDSGIIRAGTINMSRVRQGSAASTINVNGTGTLSADTINMTSRDSGGNGLGTATATINLNGGTLEAKTIQQGITSIAGPTNINFNWNSGTIRNLLGEDLTIAAEVPLRVLTAGQHIFDVAADQKITVNSAMEGSGTGAVTKIGDGTLYLNAANTHAADTVVQAGTLAGSGSLAGKLVVQDGGTFAPGTSISTFSVGSAELQTGSIFHVEVEGDAAGEFDRLISAGTVTLGGDLIVELLGGFEPLREDVFVIIEAASVAGTFDSISVVNGFSFQVAYLNDQVVLFNYFNGIPEPSSVLLLGLGMLGLAGWRRKGSRG